MQLWSVGAVISSLQKVQGKAMLGDQENLIFTAQKAIACLLFIHFLHKFGAVWGIFVLIQAREIMTIHDFLVSWKIFFQDTLNLTRESQIMSPLIKTLLLVMLHFECG